MTYARWQRTGDGLPRARIGRGMICTPGIVRVAAELVEESVATASGLAGTARLVVLIPGPLTLRVPERLDPGGELAGDAQGQAGQPIDLRTPGQPLRAPGDVPEHGSGLAGR